MIKLRKFVITIFLCLFSFLAQAQVIKPIFPASKLSMSQKDFVTNVVVFSGVEFTGCFVRTHSAYVTILMYDGINISKDLELYSNQYANRGIKYNSVEERELIVQEYLFRAAVCSMQIQLR